jgi:DNA end-binding protein Ku
VLLREALESTGKIAIAKVILRTRLRLAAVKPQKKGLVLELMHYPEELIDASEFAAPRAAPAGGPEMKMALQLVESMSVRWDPARFHDESRRALKKIIAGKTARAQRGGGRSGAAKAPPSNVIDLAAALRRSLRGKKDSRTPVRKAAPRHRKAA